jgi:hypothetical protein
VKAAAAPSRRSLGVSVESVVEKVLRFEKKLYLESLVKRNLSKM